jgi:hypothetical protein
MKNRKISYWIALCILLIGSCKRSQLLDPVLENKFFRSMFRITECVVVNQNDLVLAWYGMDGAAGYRL